MSDIKEIRILPMSNSDVVSPTYDDAIDFSLRGLSLNPYFLNFSYFSNFHS